MGTQHDHLVNDTKKSGGALKAGTAKITTPSGQQVKKNETMPSPKGADEDEPQFEFEGGSDGSSDSENMAPSDKEFIDDLDSH